MVRGSDDAPPGDAAGRRRALPDRSHDRKDSHAIHHLTTTSSSARCPGHRRRPRRQRPGRRHGHRRLRRRRSGPCRQLRHQGRPRLPRRRASPRPAGWPTCSSRMTLDEKIGQMTQAERGGIDADPTQITTLGLGSVLSGGGSVPTPNTPEAWADMVDRYQRAALATRLGIPLLYGVDSVHGHGNLLGATVFPHNIGLGATRDPRLVRAGRAHHRRGDPGQRPAVGVRAVRLRRPRRPLGSHLRELRRDPAAGHLDGDRHRRPAGPPGPAERTTTGCSPPPSTSPVTASPPTAPGRTTAPGDYPIDQGVDQVSRRTFDRLALAPYVPAVRKHHVGSVMPSYSDVDWTERRPGQPGQHARQQGADHRRAQGAAGLRRAS